MTESNHAKGGKIHPRRMENIPAHLAGAANLEKLCFPQPWSETSLELLTREGIGVGYLCTAKAAKAAHAGNEEIVTAYGGMLIAVDEGQITNVAVHPDHRREGLGTAIVRALLDHAKGERLGSVSLEVRASNAAAIALYRRMGFEEVGRRRAFYTKPTEDALIMEVKLK